MKEALEALQSARDLLMRSEWVQDEPDNLTGPQHCAISPLMALCPPGVAARTKALDALDEAALALFPRRYTLESAFWNPAPTVNDHPDTTFNDVMAMYDEAERILKERV